MNVKQLLPGRHQLRSIRWLAGSIAGVALLAMLWQMQQRQVTGLQTKVGELRDKIGAAPQTPNARLDLEKALALQKDVLLLEKEVVVLQNAIYGSLAQTVGAFFFFVTAYLSWRNVRAAEEKQVTERFGKAVEQLGSDKLEVQLGGIYALERIAKDSEKDHWIIMEVLASFVRSRSVAPNVDGQLPTAIAPNVQAALTVLGRRETRYDPPDKTIYLAKTNCPHADLSLANLAAVDFTNASLPGIQLIGANLEDAFLDGALLTDAALDSANLHCARLVGANLSSTSLIGANLSEANLSNANFSAATLNRANLSRADGSNANFSNAYLSDANLRQADLSQANFAGAFLIRVDFTGADVTGANFAGANLSEAIALTPAQIQQAIVNEHTILPKSLKQSS